MGEMNNLRLTDILVKKRDGGELSEMEIRFLINGLITGRISQAQTGAMLMAMFLNGLSPDETVALTRSMMESGEVLSWPKNWQGRIVDKHSTGGVGDKVSLPLAPALAACGLKVPMISGRGLGHTGGTLDKLESLPGYQVSCSPREIHSFLEDVGACIVGQTEDLVPADKILYSTRDITGTVESMALIISSIISKKAAEGLNALVLELTFGQAAPITTYHQAHAMAVDLLMYGTLVDHKNEHNQGVLQHASIMSKKAAEGLDALVIELTHGKASLVKNESEARNMADRMIKMGKSLGIKTSALLVRMDNPIGKMIGNSLEVVEAVQCLQGGGPSDLKDLVCKLGGQLLKDTKLVGSVEEGSLQIERTLKDGSAKQKFIDMIVAQGVNQKDANGLFSSEKDMFNVLPQAKHVTEVVAETSGYIHRLDALTCGTLVHHLGAGRETPGQKINYGVGLELTVQVGDYLNTGDVWAKVHHDVKLTDQQLNLLQSAAEIQKEAPHLEDLQTIVGIITEESCRRGSF